MFSSLLPKPKHCALDTIRVVLPKTPQNSAALVVPGTDETSVVPHVSDSSKTVSEIHLDSTGLVDFAKTIAASGGQDVQASYEDTIPLKTKYPRLRHHFPRYTLNNCPDDSLAVCVAETKQVIESLLLKAEGAQTSSSDATLVHYTPNSVAHNAPGRTLEIRNYQEDPMLPPRFKLRKNREKEPSPPPPVLKAAPTEKITKEVKDKWHIPSAVSNWKNNQGFAISLDKRVHAASGGSADSGPTINIEKFGQLSSALENADKTARDEIAVRNEQRKQIALQEQKNKEKQLQELLDRSRRQSGKRGGDYGYDSRKRYRGE